MSHQRAVRTPNAPEAIGPYSQAIQAGGFLFVSGQIPLAPGGTELVPGGVSEQTERVLENVSAILTAAGATLADVVQATVYLTEMADFAAMNAVYARYFTTNPPARATVAVLALPRGARVEIGVTAALPTPVDPARG